MSDVPDAISCDRIATRKRPPVVFGAARVCRFLRGWSTWFWDPDRKLKPGESPNEALDALLDELREDPEPKRTPVRPSNASPKRAPVPESQSRGDRASTEMLAMPKAIANDVRADSLDDLDEACRRNFRRRRSARSQPIRLLRSALRRLKLATSNETESPAEPAEPDGVVPESPVEAPRKGSAGRTRASTRRI